MKRLMLIALCLSVVGCASSEHEDLRVWMQENSKNLKPKITPLPEVKPYVPVPYELEGQADPFQAARIEPDTKSRQAGGRAGLNQPDFEAREMRNSELEKYPLESMAMIGRLIINNRPMAAIKYGDKVQQVKVGEYMGFDFGMVTEISETEVKLRELIQDSAGEWSERESSLHLQTKEGSSK